MSVQQMEKKKRTDVRRNHLNVAFNLKNLNLKDIVLEPITCYEVKANTNVARSANENSSTASEYNRITIAVKLPDGRTSKLLVLMPTLFSFGLKEFENDQQHSGFSLPLVLSNKDTKHSVREPVREYTNLFEELVKHIKALFLEEYSSHLTPVQSESLVKFFPISNTEDGKVLYCKVPSLKNTNEIYVDFFDMSGKKINPLDLKGKYLNTNVCLHISDIFVGHTNVSLQVKIQECMCELVKKERLVQSVLHL